MVDMEQTWDVIVVGGGAAGLSAALMLGRARRRVLVVDAGEPRNRYAAHMHGVLGHEGLDPAELLRRGRGEVEGYGVEVRPGSVDHVDEDAEGVTVRLSSGESERARALIVATGITDALPEIPGLADHWGTSVLHCPYCHGHEVRDQRLGVLTTSPTGLHQALLIRQWSDDVTVFTAGLGGLDPADERRLLARGVRLVEQPVVEVLDHHGRLNGVRTADGEIVELDAIFTAGSAVPHDGFLAHLGLDREDGLFGSFLTVDPTGRTSSERIWAVGNVVNPMANVPVAIAAGTMAGAFVNAVLVSHDFDDAVAAPTGPGAGDLSPAEYWEDRYAGSDRMWSGRVNATMADVVGDLPAGDALDLGCGEGGDAVWLAEQGWRVTALDVSPTAVARGAEGAAGRGVGDRITWVAARPGDVVHRARPSTWSPPPSSTPPSRSPGRPSSDGPPRGSGTADTSSWSPTCSRPRTTTRRGPTGPRTPTRTPTHGDEHGDARPPRPRVTAPPRPADTDRGDRRAGAGPPGVDGRPGGDETS